MEVRTLKRSHEAKRLWYTDGYSDKINLIFRNIMIKECECNFCGYSVKIIDLQRFSHSSYENCHKLLLTIIHVFLSRDIAPEMSCLFSFTYPPFPVL